MRIVEGVELGGHGLKEALLMSDMVD